MLWPGQNPIGKQIKVGDAKERSAVIGVVKTGNYRSLGEDPIPALFRMEMPSLRVLVVHASRDPGSLLDAVQRQVQIVDRNMAATQVQTIGSFMSLPMFAARTTGLLLGRIRNSGAGADMDRIIWRDLVRGFRAHSRDWSAHGIGCGAGRRHEADHAAGTVRNERRAGDRDRRRLGVGTAFICVALRNPTRRSCDRCNCFRRNDGSRSFGLLHSSAACSAGKSCCRASLRITGYRESDIRS